MFIVIVTRYGHFPDIQLDKSPQENQANILKLYIFEFHINPKSTNRNSKRSSR